MPLLLHGRTHTWHPQVTQRLAVVWVAVTATGLWLSQLGLHALHVWDALTAERTLSPLRDWTLCMQWWAVSVLAALVLYVLQVPKLRFDVRQLVVVIIVATVVQSSLLLPASPVSVRALTERAFNWVYAMDSVAHVIGVSGELDMGALATGAADVDAVDHIEDGSMTVSMFGSHIEGSLTVNIIPYSSAELNPDGRDYCVRLRRASALDVTPTSQAVRIPVLLVGIPPWTLEYAFVDFRTGEETVRTVNVAYEDTAGGSRAAVEDNDFYVHFAKQYGLNAGGDSSDQREEAKRKYIYIETDTPGSFHLRSLQDVKG